MKRPNVERKKLGLIPKIIISVSSFIGLLFVVFIVLPVILSSVEQERDVRYERTIIVTRAFFNTVNHWPDRPLRYFNSLGEMAEHHRQNPDSNIVPLLENEITRFEEGQWMLLFSIYEAGRNLPDSLHVLVYRIAGNRIALSLYGWIQDIDKILLQPRLIFYDEDRIARDIVWSYAAEDVTSRVNGGIPIYYGIGVGPPPARISILGYEPDVIIPLTYNGREYFFWYYLDAAHFGEVFAAEFGESIEYTRQAGEMSLVTLGDVIEVFDIQVVR